MHAMMLHIDFGRSGSNYLAHLANYLAHLAKWAAEIHAGKVGHYSTSLINDIMQS